MDSCGVYVIQRRDTGDLYIGSSCRVNARWYAHKRALRLGVHHSPRLQNAWTKYGEEMFTMRVLEECPRETLLAREQEYLTAFRPVYNTCLIAGSRAGVPASAETRAQQRASMLARGPFTAEHLANIRETSQSPETRAKKVAALIGRAVSSETREKMRAAALARAPLSPEAREKIRVTLTEKRQSSEAIEKRRTANLGKRRSPESCARISAGKIAGWTKRRAGAGQEDV